MIYTNIFIWVIVVIYFVYFLLILFAIAGDSYPINKSKKSACLDLLVCLVFICWGLIILF